MAYKQLFRAEINAITGIDQQGPWPVGVGAGFIDPAANPANLGAVLFTIGVYNFPPNPGDVIYASLAQCSRAALSLLDKVQLGQKTNAAARVFGSVAGAVEPGGAAVAVPAPLATERLYAAFDGESAGLRQAISLANKKVPNVQTGSVVYPITGPNIEQVATP